MANFIGIANALIDQDSPGTQQLFRDLRDNLYAGFTNMTVYAAGAAGNFTVPANVYRIRVIATGGGGGGRGTNIGPAEGTVGTAGGNTTFGTVANPWRVEGGGGYANSIFGGTIVIGGIGSSAGLGATDRIVLNGGGGEWGNTDGGASYWGTNSYGSGGRPGMWPAPSSILHYPGAAGGTVIVTRDVTPGDVYAYSVGAAGAGGAGTLKAGYPGGGGIIVVEW